ncbi:helix-turn-helix domain-containing protein [Blautia producta]|uniref:PucR family transcriptional regulator n=1 Tax=Blautia producta TaxID=33035 RepID=UPI003A7F1723
MCSGPRHDTAGYGRHTCAVSYTIELIRNHDHVTISHPALSVLDRYDCRNHTELKKTLKEYLNCERNYVKTAARLYIHRNSLLYRLKRIEELTGIDLDNEEIRLHLMLSYLLEE